MVKGSRKLKKVLCMFLITCMAFGMIVATSATTAKAEVSTASPLQKVIIGALALSDAERAGFANTVLDSGKAYSLRADAVKAELSISDTDIKAAIDAFDALGNSSKSVVKAAVIAGFDARVRNFNPSGSGFEGIVKKINFLVTDEEGNNDGFKLAVTILKQASDLTGKPVVKDGEADAALILFDLDTSGIDYLGGIVLDALDDLIDKIESLKAKGITDFESFLGRSTNVVNKFGTSEIYNFKAYLETVDEGIYAGTVITPTPTSRTSNPPNYYYPPASTPTPTSTQAPTATSAQTTAPTPTAVVNNSDKQITDFSFKGLDPEVKGVIFERLHTIIAKVPVGTDLKALEPTVEYSGASITPESGQERNFTHPVFYTVTAGDGSRTIYVVLVIYGSNDVVEEPQEVMPGAGPYGDIYGHWAEASLMKLVENGIISGYPDGSVKPNNDITRAEVVTVLIRSLGLSVAEKTDFKFKDAKDIPSWAGGYIQAALDKGIVQGYPDNTFKAGNKVTRAEFTLMAMKAFGFGEADASTLQFADTKSIPAWAAKFIAKATELKIINGYADNTFKPDNYITRAEVSAIIDRCLTASGKSLAEQ